MAATRLYTIRGNGELREWAINTNGTISHIQNYGRVKVNGQSGNHNQFRSLLTYGFERHLLTTCNVPNHGFSLVRIDLSDVTRSTRLGTGVAPSRAADTFNARALGGNIFGLSRRVKDGVEEIWGITSSSTIAKININQNTSTIEPAISLGSTQLNHVNGIAFTPDDGEFYYVDEGYTPRRLYRTDASSLDLVGSSTDHVRGEQHYEGELPSGTSNYRAMSWNGTELQAIHSNTRLIRIDRSTPSNSSLIQTISPAPNAHGMTFTLAPTNPVFDSLTFDHDSVTASVPLDPVALSYDFTLTQANDPTVFFEQDTASNTAVFAGLVHSTSYVLSVRVIGTFGNSETITRHFTTEALGPPAPMATASDIQATQFAIDITPVIGAATYDVLVIAPDGTPLATSVIGTINLRVVFVDLTPEATYSVRVRAHDNDGNPSPYTEFSVTTLNDTPAIDVTTRALRGISLGDTTIEEIYLGNQRIEEIYLGSTKIYDVSSE